MTHFIPARNKLEAVVRISALTSSGPETLGPGSKERKSVFENLAKGLHLPFAKSDTKQILGKKIVEHLGGNWSHSCESRGQTITLHGLNLVLKLAEHHFLNASTTQPIKCTCSSLQQEVNAIKRSSALAAPKVMDGKKCVLYMKNAGGKWRLTEWHGEYFEMKLFAELVNSVGGGKRKFYNTTFDYACLHTWDIKVATLGSGKSKVHYLNDEKATNAAISNGGMGLIILSGDSKRSLAFAQWHKNLRGQSGQPRKQLTETFIPRKLFIFFIRDQKSLQSALSCGALKIQKQGSNSNKKPRPRKYGINLSKAKQCCIFVEEVTL